MKENVDKLLENSVEKAMKSAHLESPSIDFTKSIMAHVNSKSAATVYKPLISRTGWTIIFGCVTTFVVYLYVVSGVDTNKWFETVDFNIISANGIANFFSKLKLDQVTSYAMLACGVMLCAQIPILKYFIDKRQRGFF